MTGHDAGEVQLAFDFDELAREDARARTGEWDGAPLHFATGYYPPAALDAAFEHWCFINGRFDSVSRSHMWHRAIAHDSVEFDGHRAGLFCAHLGPDRSEEGPGGRLAQAICEPCDWHVIGASENEAVQAWHDHAVPGWRDLPVVPRQIRVRTEKGLTTLAKAWIEQRYPADMQAPGAPIITERGPHATRHVPGYSPWGGYDLSATALSDDNDVCAPLAARRTPSAFVPAAPPPTGRRPGGRGLVD